MPRKTRKTSAVNKADSKELDVLRNKENKEESNVDSFSLPILSDEKINSDDKCQKIMKFEEGKIPKVLIPKVRLTCLPLNIEKVIDLRNNKIIKDGIIKKKTKSKEKVSKKPQSLKPIVIKPTRNLRPRFKDEEEYRYLYNPSSSNLNVDSCKQKKKINIYIKESKFILRKSPVDSCKNSKRKEIKSNKCNLKGDTEYCIEQKNINKIEEAQKVVHDVNFNHGCNVESAIEEEFELKDSGNKKSEAADKFEPQQTCIKPLVFCPEDKKCDFGQQLDYHDSDKLTQTSLHAAVQFFMNKTQLEIQKDVDALKKGLCLVWMANNYKCSIKLCPYHHNASSLFTKKLKQYSSRHVLSILLSMKNDALFVDGVLAAFKVLSERKAPDIWVTFLVYFVFYVTEPSDSRFFKFWASAARFFYHLGENFAAARGFASLLSIFSHGDKSEEWKIVEFIEFIRQSPIQIHPTYDLLQPVLKLDLPSQVLLEAVKSSIATEKDVLEVYFSIIPKISIKSSSVPVTELLLEFCNTLESLCHENLAVELKQKLQEKVRTFKIKIFHRDYPLTAAFQEQVLAYANTQCNAVVNTCMYNTNPDSDIVLRENNYFKLEEDFYNNLTRLIELNCANFPGDSSNVDEKKMEVMLSKEEENTCDRQVTRVKQFFTDCHFDVLGKYLNSVNPDVVEVTAQEFLKALFQMKITLQQVVDLIKIILFHCRSETSAKINASICVTLIVNLVRINEWEKAYTILSLCDEKGINLVEGKVYHCNELSNITQFRIILVILEIYIYQRHFQTALNIVKTYYLYSINTSHWKNNDEAVRVKILEEFLAQTVSRQLTSIARDLFMLIWIEQNTLNAPIDLAKFANDMLILLLNQNVEEGVKFYERTKAKVTLNETSTRAIVVTLVGQNNLQAAKSIMLAVHQPTYTLPEVTPEGATVTMSSLWLEEEIYVLLDCLFDMLVNEMNPTLRNHENFEVNLHVVKPKATCSNIRPLCLGLINPSLEHACKRIERVLQNHFKPSIKLIILPYSLVLDKPSLQLYLERRFRRVPE